MKRVWMAVGVALVGVLGLALAVMGQNGVGTFQPFSISVVHEEPVTVTSTTTTAAGEVVTVTTPLTIAVDLRIDVMGQNVAAVAAAGSTMAELSVEALETGVQLVDNLGYSYEVAPADGLEIVQIRSRLDEYDDFTVEALLRNVGDTSINFPAMVMTLFDADGNFIGGESMRADMAELGPGETTPASVYVNTDGLEIGGYLLQAE